MKRFYQVWLVALVAKTLLAIWLPFSNDEAYYWVWGHHPQLSYFDHPAAVGWLFWLGTFFENFGNAARLPGVWVAHATLLIWGKILEPHLEEKNLTFWLIFVLFSPFLGLGSLIITPDIPLMFLWSLSLLVLLRLLAKPSPAFYALFGVCLGLGFCSKYMIVIFVPTALVSIAYSKQWRGIRWSYLPLTILTGLIFCAPVIYWNSQHDWASFRFQLQHGLQSEKRDLTWPLEYLGGQILIAFPLVIWCALRKSKSDRPVPRFLTAFAWFPIAFFLYTSFKAHVEANWPIMAYPALLALSVAKSPRGPLLKITLGIWILANVLLLGEVAHHWLPVDPSRLKTSEFTRYDLFVPAATEKSPIVFGSYQAAAAVSYKLRQQFYKLHGLNREDFYDFVPESTPKDDSFWIGCETDQGLPLWVTDAGYREVSSTPLSKEFRLVEVKRVAQGPSR